MQISMTPRIKQPVTIGEYISTCPTEAQKLLEKMRQTIKESAPGAEETISYQIPTFRLNGQNLVHFAAFKDHISFFPTSSGREAFSKELSGYKGGRGTIQFPLGKPIPFALVRKIVKFRVRECQGARTSRK